MTDAPAVRVYVCRCGPNLAELLDLEELVSALRPEPGVEAVILEDTACSEAGQARILEDLSTSSAQRFVVVGCSPREHLGTFMRLARRAGRNPYLVAMANVREQCAWVSGDRGPATRKATALARAAVARVRLQKPLEERDVECCPDVAVIGSGVAGLTAARTAAEAGRRVVLIEREPCAGGQLALMTDLFPGLECASCVLDPLLDEVLHHPGVEAMTLSEVDEVLGFRGNFTLRIRRHPRRVDASGCYGCGSCHEACPVEVPNRFEAGLAAGKAIFIPYAGAVPHVSCVDPVHCLHVKDRSCDACAAACPFGNIRLADQDEIVERRVGAVIVATGAPVDQVPPASGSGIYGAYAVERLLNNSGPTRGAVSLQDGRTPGSVALLHGVFEGDECRPDRFTAIDGSALTKYAVQLRHKLPEARIFELLWDRTLTGKGIGRLTRSHEAAGGIEEIRLRRGDTVRATQQGERVRIDWTGDGGPRTLEVDMAIVTRARRRDPGTGALAARLRLPLDADGFVVEDNEHLRPFSTRVEGVFVAGCAQASMDSSSAAAQGAAAAGVALSLLVPGRRLPLDPAVATVREALCSRCSICLSACPFGAIRPDPEGRAFRVEETLCRGCGTCAAACPSGAIEAQHYTSEQLAEEIDALLR